MTSGLPYPKAILFDWDGTLSDSLARLQSVISSVLVEMGYPPATLEQTHKSTIYGNKGGEFVFGLSPEEGAKFYKIASERYFVFSDDSVAMNGADALIASIPADIKIGVVTNCRRDLFDAQLSHFGWVNRFDVTVCIDEAPRNKPNPDPAIFALEKLGITPGPDVWFVGDTQGDIDCAHGAGLTSVLLAEIAPDDLSAHHHIMHLDHLTRHFQNDR